MMRTRDEIERDIKIPPPKLANHTYTEVLLILLLETTLDCRELLSEHAIAHHLLKPELKAEIAEMMVQAMGKADDHANS